MNQPEQQPSTETTTPTEPTTGAASPPPEAGTSQEPQAETQPPAEPEQPADRPVEKVPEKINIYRELHKQHTQLVRNWKTTRVESIKAWHAARANRTHTSPSDLALAEAYRAEQALLEFEIEHGIF